MTEFNGKEIKKMTGYILIDELTDNRKNSSGQ